MCMAVYLASDTPLPLISWSKDDPGFNVVELHDEEKAVKRHFSKSHIYYVGAHTGCSCGFAEEKDERPEDALNSRKAFAAYVAKAIVTGPLELFVCWEGDWGKNPERKIKLTPEDLIEPEKWHRELTHAIISTATLNNGIEADRQ